MRETEREPVEIFKANTPAVPKRGVHFDLKGLPPTPKRMEALLTLFAEMRYNVVLFEWDDSFPWTVEKRFCSRMPYKPQEVKLFVETAARLGMEVIPLVESLGHMETPLSVSGYEHLREIPDIEAGLNPLAPGARELVQNMVDDVLRLMPHVRYFHLGGGEAKTFGKNLETAAYITEHGKAALYLHHVGPILDALNVRGIRPILWDDMMIDWESDALNSLAGKCDLMSCGYRVLPDDTSNDYRAAHIKRLSEHGFTLWGATAYKGTEGYDADLPDIPLHQDDALKWVDLSKRYGFEGVVATGRSRYAAGTLQCNPIDSCLDSALMVAVCLHDGAPPAAGTDACLDALDALGEKARFQSCRAAMVSLRRLRQSGWTALQQALQVSVLCKRDSRRPSARNLKLGFHALLQLKKIVQALDDVCEEVRQCFAGLVDPIWIDAYLATRVEPLCDELDRLLSHHNLEGVGPVSQSRGWRLGLPSMLVIITVILALCVWGIVALVERNREKNQGENALEGTPGQAEAQSTVATNRAQGGLFLPRPGTETNARPPGAAQQPEPVGVIPASTPVAPSSR